LSPTRRPTGLTRDWAAPATCSSTSTRSPRRNGSGQRHRPRQRNVLQVVAEEHHRVSASRSRDAHDIRVSSGRRQAGCLTVRHRGQQVKKRSDRQSILVQVAGMGCPDRRCNGYAARSGYRSGNPRTPGRTPNLPCRRPATTAASSAASPGPWRSPIPPNAGRDRRPPGPAP
jgi:hypothetical protein